MIPEWTQLTVVFVPGHEHEAIEEMARGVKAKGLKHFKALPEVESVECAVAKRGPVYVRATRYFDFYSSIKYGKNIIRGRLDVLGYP